jgi:hypothetical protein
MMGHQARNAIVSTDPAQKAGTVKRVKSGVGHSRPVPDVVQPGRRYQATIGQPKSLSNPLRPVPNTLHMPPPSRQLGQAPLGENPRISGRHHGFEPMRGNEQEDTWCRARCPTMRWPPQRSAPASAQLWHGCTRSRAAGRRAGSPAAKEN